MKKIEKGSNKGQTALIICGIISIVIIVICLIFPEEFFGIISK